MNERVHSSRDGSESILDEFLARLDSTLIMIAGRKSQKTLHSRHRARDRARSRGSRALRVRVYRARSRAATRRTPAGGQGWLFVRAVFGLHWDHRPSGFVALVWGWVPGTDTNVGWRRECVWSCGGPRGAATTMNSSPAMILGDGASAAAR